MHKLMGYINNQIDDIERKAEKDGKLSMSEVEYLDKLAHIKKSLLTSEAMDDESEYSQNDGRRYSRGRYYDGMGSYARGRNARRDSMGRYSTAEAADMVDDIKDLMHNAPDQQTKQEMQRIINRLESM